MIKKMMMMACAILMTVAANAQSFETKNEVETVPFVQTLIDVPAHVYFVVGDRFGFSVEAGDEVLGNLIQCSVKDGVLTFKFDRNMEEDAIYYDANASEFDSEEADDVEYVITITAPIVPEIITSSNYEQELM